MIPESEWVWMGHPAHFCDAANCGFRLATKVGAFIISTVGEYYPGGSPEMQPIGFNRYFETYVFRVGEVIECGCIKPSDWTEIDSDGYQTAIDAQNGHRAMCRKYAGLEEGEEA